jgi:hypothetical protein
LLVPLQSPESYATRARISSRISPNAAICASHLQ